MNANLLQRIETARAQVDVAWTDERAQAVGRQMVRRKRRRDAVRTTSLVVASLVVILGVAFGAQRLWGPRSLPNVAVAPSAATNSAVFKLSDGSVVSPIDPNSSVRMSQNSPTRVVVEVVTGGARFDVVQSPGRVFRVEAGRVAVEVLGTSFSVERVGDEAARVAVERGRVRVSWDQQSVELGAGEQGVFPRQDAPATSASVSSSATESAPPNAPVAPAVAPSGSSRPSWRTLHQEGDFDKAWEALQREGIDKVRDEAGELLAAADVARMSKHSSQAVGPLRRLLSSHPGDPRAPLAAFTLGRVLLDELGRPREAATAFAQARRGAMAEDALAREVEAWSRAGDAATARARAEEYLKAYPQGRRERSVRRYGGLE